jgi:hypothetical protein
MDDPVVEKTVFVKLSPDPPLSEVKSMELPFGAINVMSKSAVKVWVILMVILDI